MSVQPSTQDIERVAREFLIRLNLKHATPHHQCGVFIGGFPGSGKTTVAQQFLPLSPHLVHVQANDARVLLSEMGFAWGKNVRAVLKLLVEEMLFQGHSLILDGAFIEDGSSLRTGLILKFSLKSLLVAVTTTIQQAETRAARRYNDNQPSRFGDWRASSLEAYLENMYERYPKLVELIRTDHSITTISNHTTTDELRWKVGKIWADFQKK